MREAPKAKKSNSFPLSWQQARKGKEYTEEVPELFVSDTITLRGRCGHSTMSLGALHAVLWLCALADGASGLYVRFQ